MCKPYYSLNDYCKQTFGQKVYKLALDAGLSCPNRDGTLDTRGCIFCSAGGSGDFATKIGSPRKGVSPEAICLMKTASMKHPGSPFIAYFQAFTGTYGPTGYLREIYTLALSQPDVIGLSIGTRPDCISSEVLCLLLELRKQFPEKFIWIELGLQTIHDQTAEYIRRGYDYAVFLDTYHRLTTAGFPVILHLILGLPFETDHQIYDTMNAVNQLHPFGVKLQLLHILEHTDLASEYRSGRITALTLEKYLELVAGSLARLSPDIVIHRVTGDGPKDITIAPTWSFNKKNVLNSLHRLMKEQDLYQGKFLLCQPT